MASVASPIPARSFVPTPNRQPAVYLHDGNPQYDGQSRIIRRALEYLGVTRWQLSKLLGAPETNYVYHWLSGQRHMSSFYYARMMWLVMERTGGLATHRIKSVDWVHGSIEWRGDEPQSAL